MIVAVEFMRDFGDFVAVCPVCPWEGCFWDYPDEAQAELEEHEYWAHGREGQWDVVTDP